MIELKLSFGGIPSPIEELLQAQGLTLGISAPMYQRAADSILFLRVHGYLTASAADSAYKKLMKEIAKEVKELS